MPYQVNQEILDQIDALELGGRLAQWRSAMKAAGFRVEIDRQVLFMESWERTEGEDIEMRRALALKHICENIPISILPWELIVGKATQGVIGALPEMDISGDYIPAIWDDDSDDVRIGYSATAVFTDEEKEALRRAADQWRDKNVISMVNSAIDEVYGDWYQEANRVFVRDPGISSAIFAGSTSSCDFPYILQNGVGAYIRRARKYIEAERVAKEPDAEKIIFWRASIVCMEALICIAHRYADLAEEMATSEPDDERRAQLTSIAKACRNVPEKPATTLQEALQSMAIVGLGKIFEHPMYNYPHWGRGDQHLQRFFMSDYEAGRITVEDAAQMVGELVGRWATAMIFNNDSMRNSHQINYGISQVVLGGYGQTHEDMSNEMSALFLKVVAMLHLSAPTVSIRWNVDTPDWLMKRAIDCNLATRGGIPLFQNDSRIISKYVETGIPYNEACEWFGLGCVYPTLLTRAEHYGMEGLASFNLAGMLHLALHNGRDINGYQLGVDCGDARDFKSIEQIIDALFAQHKLIVDRSISASTVALAVESRYFRTPFWSTVGCPWYFENGQDLLIADGDYSVHGFSDRAIIDTADSLVAIKKLVFDEKRLTMAELMDAIDSDFAGERGEEIRQMCLAAPKFGNDIDEADYMVSLISDRSAAYIRAKRIPSFSHGSIIVRDGLSWHLAAGLGVGALPDGRHAFEPLDDGSFSPMGGADTNGPTAVMRSVLKAEQKDAGASVLNQKFSASLLQSEENREKLAKYTDTFLRNGGSHIQYNIVDSAELKEAQVKPEGYSDLVVRIGGFSAYFTQLSEGIQNDVIVRSEQSL